MKHSLLQLVGALIVLIIVASGYGLWFGAVQAKSAQVGSLESQITQKTQDASHTAQAEQELASLTTAENSIDQYFVSTNDVVPFLTQLESTGQFLGSNVQVISVSATPASPGTPYGQLTLSLKITGSFDAVMRTIGAVEYGPYDTTILALSFNTPQDQVGGAGSASSWTANATFIVGTQDGTTQDDSAQASSQTNSGTSTAPSVPVSTTTSSTPVPQSAESTQSPAGDVAPTAPAVAD